MISKLIRIPITFVVWSYTLGLLLYLALRLVIGDGFWLLGWLNNFTPYYFIPMIILLPLALLLRSKHLMAISIILTAIGLMWIVPRFVPDNWTAYHESEIELSLKVVTFNMWGGNQNLDEVIIWLRETDADVVLLQEVSPEWAGEDMEELIDIYPYQVTNMRYWWGEAILSRYPITAHEQYNDLPMNRIEIDVNSTTIAVYNVHVFIPQGDTTHLTLPIEHPSLNMLLRYDDSARNDQIDQLLTILEDEENPFIVAGDFNMSDNAVKYGDVAGPLNDSFRGAGIGFGTTWPVAEIANFPDFIPPLLRIDYIWHSDHFVALNAETGPQLGSDHLPYLATLGLKSYE